MDSNLTDTIINQVIGAVIGTIVSFAISWYFYVKSDGPGRIIRSMIEQLTLATILERIGGEYTTYPVPAEQYPKDKDVPHIVMVWLPISDMSSHLPSSIIFRARDLGMNFKGQIEVREVSSNQTLKTQMRGYGYYSVALPLLRPSDPAKTELLVTLTDSIGKSHTQRILVSK